jgi:type VI secretion system secreted protein VgrG
MAVIRNRAAEADLAFRAGKLAADVLQVVQFNGQEEISRLFHFTLELASKDGEIDFTKVLGQPATLTIVGEPETRFVNGIVCRFEQAGRSVDFTRYRAELVPTVWLLTQRQDCRIFQEKSVPDIVKQVLEDAGVPSDAFRLALQGTYTPRTYCVQYRESGWEFIARLLEEEGIFYFFEHTEAAHVLVLGDNPNAHKDVAAPAKVLFNTGGIGVTTEEAFTAFRVTQEIRPGSVVLRDFDFTHPSLDLTAEKEGEGKALQVYDYPGGYQVKDRGTALATARLQEEQAAVKQATGRSDCRRLISGFTFTLDGHERADFNQKYLVTAVHHYGSQPQTVGAEAGAGASADQPVYENDVECIPAATPFRPARTTPRPLISGSQTAIVVGPSGEEVHTDEHARVKVQFHWDRQGQYDDKASCWVRVSQGWAGGGYGMVFLPRVGQEVIVDFLEGDPDQPIITGRVYNAEQMPPLNLPTEKTRSTIKTSSSKGGGGSNEISFEDKKGDEQLLLHAEKDLDFRVKHDRREHVGNDRHLVVVRDKIQKVERDEHSLVDRDQVTEITRDHSLKVGKNQSVEVTGDRSSTVKGDVIEAHKKNYSQEVGSDLYIKAMGLVIEGMKELTIKVGGSFLKIDSSGVTISGTQIKLNSGGAAGSGKMGKAVAAAAPLAAAIAATIGAGKDVTASKKATAMDPIVANALAAPTHKDPKEDEEEKSWLEVELVDEADEPVAGEKVLVTLPDGKVYSGRTNKDGVLKVTGVDKGATCQITFPDLDKEAWEKA